MTRWRACLCLLSLACAAGLGVGAAGPRLEAVISGDADLVVLIENFPAAREAWAQGPLGRTWNDPQVVKFFAPLRRTMQIDDWERMSAEEIGHPLSEVLDAFSGQAALVFPDLPEAVRQIDEGGSPQVALLARVGDTAIVEAVLEAVGTPVEQAAAELGEQLGIELRAESEDVEFQGETLHVERMLDPEGRVIRSEAHGFIDGFLVMTQPWDYARELVAGLKKGSVPDAWRDARAVRTIREQVRDYDVVAYLDIRGLVPLMVEQARLAQQQEQEESGPNPMAIDPEALFGALGLDSIEALFLSGGLGDAETRLDFGLLHGEEKGVVKLLAYGPGPVKLPEIIPADVLQASVVNFSVPRMWAAAVEMFQRVNPMFATMFGMMREQGKATVGFDPVESFFAALGDRLISADFLPAPDRPGATPSLERTESVWGISVKDRQALEMAIGGLKTLAGGGGELFEQRDYLGQTIYTFKMPLPAEEGAPEQLLSYAITDDYLLLGAGSTMPIESLLGRMRRPGASLWQRADVRAALRRLPEGASGFGYSDVAAFMKGLFDLIAGAQAMTAENEEKPDEEEPFCDPAAKPDARTLERYFDISVSGFYRSEGLLHVSSRLLHPER